MDEAACVARARAGDREAFAALFAQYEHRIFVYLRSRLGSHRADEAADLTQLTFLRAFAALAATEEGLNLKAWLYRIATNASTDWHRQRARRCAWDERVPEPVDRDRLADPATRVLDMETRAAVARTLRAMRPLHRQALVLREYGGLSCAAIGARLGLTPAAVKSLLFRARAEFRGLHRP